MKTTITLPHHYHRELRKMALDRSKTMADLICEAIKATFFSEEDFSRETPHSSHPLQGLLVSSTSEREIRALKEIWAKKQ